MEDIAAVLASIRYDIVSWFESSAGTDLRSTSQDDFERSIALIDDLDRRLQQVCKRRQVVFLFKWLHFCAPDLIPIADNLAWKSWCDLIREVRRHGVQVPTDVAAVMADTWQIGAVFAFWRWLVTDLVSEDGWQAMKGAQEAAVLRSPLGLLDKLFWMRKHKDYNEMNNQPYEFEYHN